MRMTVCNGNQARMDEWGRAKEPRMRQEGKEDPSEVTKPTFGSILSLTIYSKCPSSSPNTTIGGRSSSGTNNRGKSRLFWRFFGTYYQ
jgi:hypothetical protein